MAEMVRLIRVFKGPGKGKTCELIRLSALHGYTMVVRDEKDKARVLTVAKELGLTVAMPITYDEFWQRRYMGRKLELMIDDVDALLRHQLSSGSRLAGYSVDEDYPGHDKAEMPIRQVGVFAPPGGDKTGDVIDERTLIDERSGVGVFAPPGGGLLIYGNCDISAVGNPKHSLEVRGTV